MGGRVSPPPSSAADRAPLPRRRYEGDGDPPALSPKARALPGGAAAGGPLPEAEKRCDTCRGPMVRRPKETWARFAERRFCGRACIRRPQAVDPRAGPIGQLSRLQHALLTALLIHPMVTDAARAAGLAVGSARNMLRHPAFQAAYRDALAEQRQQATNRLAGQLTLALDALEAALTASDLYVRLKAAEMVFKWVLPTKGEGERPAGSREIKLTEIVVQLPQTAPEPAPASLPGELVEAREEQQDSAADSSPGPIAIQGHGSLQVVVQGE